MQNKQELIKLVAHALKNSGRTCDEDNVHEVMASEALRSLKPTFSALEKRIKELEEENAETHSRVWILQERLKEEINKNTTF